MKLTQVDFSRIKFYEKGTGQLNENFTIHTKHIKAQFTMAQAKEEDTENVLSLLVETAQWFKDNGSTQWNALLQGIDSHGTAGAVQRGDVFICKDETEIAGMVMLLQKPSKWDQNLWALQEEQPNTAIYLHRLAISRKYAKHQLGEAILNWCKESIHFKGKDKIRLDCVASNEFLNAFYRRTGYTYVGEKRGLLFI